MTSLKFAPHVQKALDEGKLWRAKEILGGRVASSEYSPELYEQYGVVLLTMGDDLEAGKYLFLSGTGNPDYASAIELFLTRNTSTDARQFLASFPSRLHKVPFAELPERVRAELESRRAHVIKRQPAPPPSPLPVRARLQRGLLAFTCLTALLFCLFAMFVGFRAMLLWLR